MQAPTAVHCMAAPVTMAHQHLSCQNLTNSQRSAPSNAHLCSIKVLHLSIRGSLPQILKGRHLHRGHEHKHASSSCPSKASHKNNNMPCMHRQLSCCRAGCAGCEHVLTLLTYTGACAQVTLHVVKARQHIVRMRSSTCCPYSQVYAYKSRLHHKRRVTYPANLCSCQATGTIATQRQFCWANQREAQPHWLATHTTAAPPEPTCCGVRRRARRRSSSVGILTSQRTNWRSSMMGCHCKRTRICQRRHVSARYSMCCRTAVLAAPHPNAAWPIAPLAGCAMFTG